MKKITHSILTAILLLSLILLCALPAAADGTQTVFDGQCGEGLTWQLDTVTGELVISGEGAMQNYSITQTAPWYEHRAYITSARLESGVTTVGSYAFLYCNQLVSVSFPDTLESVTAFAFWNCPALESVVLPEGVTALGVGSFQNCGSLQSVSLPHSLTSVGNAAFSDTPVSLALYNGTSEEWAAVTVGANNTTLTEALVMHPGHTFDREVAEDLYFVSPADCIEAAQYYKSCVCGEAGDEVFSYGEPVGHTGGTPTCTEQAVCEACDTPYGDILPHTPNGVADCLNGVSCTVCATPLEEAKGHNHEATVTPPTCTKEGFTTHVCADCGNTYTDTPVEATGHTYGDPATCLEDQLCTVCGEKLADRLGHDHQSKVTQDPTCTVNGIRTYTCSRCGDSYDESIEAAGHTPGAEATCTEDQVCTVCETILTAKLNHDYQDTVVPPTCDKQGYTTHTCSRCSDTRTDTLVPAKGHTAGAAATCHASQVCTECQTVLTPQLEHDYRDTLTKAPTCDETGIRTYTCEHCGDSYERSIPVSGHKPGTPATCTEAQTCTDCGAVVNPKLGHALRDTTVQPTCTEQGYTSHVCTRCSTTYLDTFTPAKGHTHGEAATCTEPQICTVCSALLADSLGHEYTSQMVEPTCDGQGYTLHTCSRCSANYMDTLVPAKGHTPGDEATCRSPQVCTVCNHLLAEALSHSYEETVTEATCTTDGHVTRTCSLCGDSVIASVTPATGHVAEEDWSLLNQPDVGEPGRRQKACSSCSAILETETFWETVGDTNSDPEESKEHPQDSAPIHKEEEEEGGCKNVGGNILVVVIALAALVLLWSVDFRRRH